MRRRLLTTVGLAVIAACAAVTGLAGWAAVDAARSLERAQDALQTVRASTHSGEQVLSTLRSADTEVGRARRSLDHWAVDVVVTVPVLGRSWRAERAVARTAGEVVGGAVVLANALPSLSASGGGVDLAALARLRSALAGPASDSRAALRDLRRTPTGFTPPQVQDAVADARRALGPAVQGLAQAEKGLAVAGGLLGQDGARSVLVMLQNNAELRGAGGYSSSFATGQVADGRLVLGPLQDLGSVADSPADARRVAAPEEYTEDFAEVGGNSTMWRTWNMSPHVPDAALVSARIAGALLGREPDVVVLLDVPAMATFVELGGGPVQLPDGTEVEADELTGALLVDAYAAAGADTSSQVRRRAQLQAAATEHVSRLLAGGAPMTSVGPAVADLAARRHLAVWSAREAEQRDLVELGLAGAVVPPTGGDIAHVSVNNVGANKLDVYVDREVSVDVVVGAHTATVVQRVRFTNEAPEGLVPYVAGVSRPGTVVSRVELSLPPGAQGLRARADGGPWPGELHSGGGRDRLLIRLELPRGGTSELEVRYTLPLEEGRYDLAVVPQPLAEDADLSVRLAAAEGQQLGEVTGAVVEDGVAEVAGPLRTTVEVSAALQQPPRSFWSRLQRWWTSPVRIG